MRASTGLLAILLAACAGAPAPQPAATTPAPAAAAAIDVPPAPPARVEVVTDDLHGMQVRDPYRWMEKGGEEMNAWLEAQGKRAKTVLAALPRRAEMLQAITEADRGVTRVSIVDITGRADAPRLFLMKRKPDDEVAQLWVRDGWNGTDRLLVDPRARNQGNVHHSIDYSAPSWDGKHVAYGISASGSEDSVIEVMEVDSGRVLPERIDRAQYASIAWRPDNRSFFYWRRARPAPNATRADWFKNSATYLHVLGEDPEKEQPVFGPAMRELGLCEECFSWIQVSPTSRWALAGATPGTSADLQYFIAPLDAIRPGLPIPWRRVSGPADKVWGMTAHGERLFAYTYGDAPRFKVVEIDPAAPTVAASREFIRHDEDVLDAWAAAQDGMYVSYNEGGKFRLERIGWNGTRETIALPYSGTISGLSASPDKPGARFYLETWTRPFRVFAVDANRQVRDLNLMERWPVDYSHLTSEEVEVKSADGTLVPLSIVYRRDMARDGSAAAILDGYAAYGSPQTPYFAPIRLAWVDRGGVAADCHARGGGARGKEWHSAGIKHNKERGIEDFIACAEYLIANKYTSASRLTGTGTSAGGILIGGAVTRRPDLFTAAFVRVPVANLMRFEASEGGPANVPEYGTVANADDMRAILASDPYHRVKEGTRYPAMVVTGGMHDVRVPVWQPAKFVARVQSATTGGPVLFRVETGAGHGLGSRRSQVREEWADLYAFALWRSGK
jgi:prolyl oligopeptidase